MKTHLFINFVFIIFRIYYSNASLCGCKTVRTCYREMVESLQDRDEESCLEDVSVGVSTVMIYLKALKQFCPEFINVVEDAVTYEGRRLYEVVMNVPLTDTKKEENKPSILIDAGQQASIETVGLALYVIEQLLACEENNEMISKAKWVILPSTNPDGLEYGRFNRVSWKKNVRPSEDGLSYGVDISRNFDTEWTGCDRIESGFHPEFPGLSASSENETTFIKNSLSHHKKNLKVYISMRRDGHAILYPYAYTKKNIKRDDIIKVAADVAAKVNQRASGVQIFSNQSIYEENGKPHCGHSVDYAYSAGVPFAYELRVFIGNDNRIMSKFQQLPRGYESSLRLGYLSGIREIYNQVIVEKKAASLF